jgi:hypothetical protein
MHPHHKSSVRGFRMKRRDGPGRSRTSARGFEVRAPKPRLAGENWSRLGPRASVRAIPASRAEDALTPEVDLASDFVEARGL